MRVWRLRQRKGDLEGNEEMVSWRTNQLSSQMEWQGACIDGHPPRQRDKTSGGSSWQSKGQSQSAFGTRHPPAWLSQAATRGSGRPSRSHCVQIERQQLVRCSEEQPTYPWARTVAAVWASTEVGLSDNLSSRTATPAAGRPRVLSRMWQVTGDLLMVTRTRSNRVKETQPSW